MTSEIERLELEMVRMQTSMTSAHAEIDELCASLGSRTRMAFAAGFVVAVATATSLTVGAQPSVPNKVTGPFEVVDSAGKPIMRIGAAGEGITRGAYFYNSAGNVVAAITALQDQGGLVRVIEAGNDGTSASIAAVTGTIGLTVRMNNLLRAQVGANEQGRVGARIFDGQGAPQISAEAMPMGGLLTASHRSGRITVGVSPGIETPGVRIHEGPGPPRVEMSMAPKTGNGYFHANGAAAGWAQLAVGAPGGYVVVSKVGGGETGLSALSRNGSAGPSTAELSASNGRMALRINNPQGVQIAALGESPIAPGSGSLRVFNSSGQPQVSADSMPSGGALNVFANSRKLPVAAVTTEKDGRGALAVYNAAGSAAAALTESDMHANTGRIYVNDAAGGWVFGAGWTGAGGDACINSKSGFKCLGIGLPGLGR